MLTKADETYIIHGKYQTLVNHYAQKNDLTTRLFDISPPFPNLNANKLTWGSDVMISKAALTASGVAVIGIN